MKDSLCVSCPPNISPPHSISLLHCARAGHSVTMKSTLKHRHQLPLLWPSAAFLVGQVVLLSSQNSVSFLFFKGVFVFSRLQHSVSQENVSPLPFYKVCIFIHKRLQKPPSGNGYMFAFIFMLRAARTRMEVALLLSCDFFFFFFNYI